MTDDNKTLDTEVPSPKRQKIKRRLKCEECEYTTQCRGRLVSHTMLHHGGECRYKCKICGYGAVYPAQLHKHIQKHHAEADKDGGFKCEYCDYTHPTATGLEGHVLIHRDLFPFKCDDCGYRTRDPVSFNLHKGKHGTKSGDKDIVKLQHKFVCQECGHSTNKRQAFFRHQNTHLAPEDRPFKCTSCKYTANTKVNFDKHTKTRHSDGSVHECEKCDFSAVTKKTIDKHKASCTGEKPYHCSKCEFKTAMLKMLREHAEIHI